MTDDLFGDDEDIDDESSTPAKKEKGEGLGDAPKKSYLNEDWNLSPEDAKEFKGFPGMKSVGAEPVEPADRVSWTATWEHPTAYAGDQDDTS